MEGVLPTSDILHCVLSAAALAGEKGQGWGGGGSWRHVMTGWLMIGTNVFR